MIASTHIVEANGLRLHYRHWHGSGPTVVCLHGTSFNASMWERLADDLVPEFDLVALDQRGHGDSDSAPPGQYGVEYYADDLAAFIDVLGLKNFCLIGFSLGSRVALQYAASNSARIDRLIFLDLSFEMPQSASEEMMAGLRRRPRSFKDFEEALVYARKLPDRQLFSDAMQRRVLAGDLREDAHGRLVWRYDLDGCVETLRVAARDMWSEVGKTSCPTLILRGEQSTVLTAPTVARLQREFVNGEVMTVPGAGHSIWGDNPAATNAAIVSFLRDGDFSRARAAIEDA